MNISRFKFGVSGCVRRGFTLLEMMIVVAIVGIIATMGLPAIYHAMSRDSIGKAENAILDACNQARAQAILNGGVTELRFHPLERRMEVAGGSSASADSTSTSVSEEVQHNATVSGGLSATLPEDVVIEMLDVNLIEYKDAEEAKVRFYPNGVCDEMTIVLRSGKNDFRMISLEVTTSLASVQTDPSKWK
jgi:prepilin-type N-terminal cleavage/methylation domain-containing protein